MRCQKRDGIDVLESCLPSIVCFCSATQYEKWPGIGCSVRDLYMGHYGSMDETECLCSVLRTPAITWKTPGPPTEMQTPGLPVR
jgi:hypothetical protein